MKRCVLAVVTLVAVNLGLASADYVIIKVDLNQVMQVANQPAAPAGTGTPGNPNMPLPGQFGPGAQGGFQPPGAGAGIPARRGGAFRPFVPPPAAAQPAAGTQPGTNAAGAAKQSSQPPVYVYAYVEVKKFGAHIPASKQIPFDILSLELKAGNQKTDIYVPFDAMSSHAQGDLIFQKIPTLTSKFNTKFNAALRDGSEELKKKNLVSAAEWALQRGLLNEFNKAIDEIKKLDAKYPVVLAVEKTREELKKKPTEDDPAAQSLKEDLRKEAYRPWSSDAGHYTLFTNGKGSESDLKKEMDRRLAHLEETYATFFYWLALKGQPRTPPPYRLVVAIVDTPKADVWHRGIHAAYNFVPMVGGGFTAQHDNVLLVSTRRMDEAFEKLSDYNQTKLQELSMDTADLFKPAEFFKNTSVTQSGKSPAVLLSILQTLALCEKSMSDETELLALSHGAARQLISATGIMPANVETAEWARFGFASLFEVSPQSFYPSYGGLNWARHIDVKAMRKTRVIEKKDAKDILVKIVTDGFFRQAYATMAAADNAKDDRGAMKHKAEDDLDVARDSAWSLMHYLAVHKYPQLERYFAELRALPRDVSHDNRVLRDCFYRSFGLLKADPDDASRQIADVTAVDNLVAAWFADTDKNLQLDIPEYQERAIGWREDTLKARRGQQPSGSGIAQPGPGAQQRGIQSGIGGDGGIQPPDKRR
jgi:hypothetical protein